GLHVQPRYGQPLDADDGYSGGRLLRNQPASVVACRLRPQANLDHRYADAGVADPAGWGHSRCAADIRRRARYAKEGRTAAEAGARRAAGAAIAIKQCGHAGTWAGSP